MKLNREYQAQNKRILNDTAVTHCRDVNEWSKACAPHVFKSHRDIRMRNVTQASDKLAIEFEL